MLQKDCARHRTTSIWRMDVVSVGVDWVKLKAESWLAYTGGGKMHPTSLEFKTVLHRDVCETMDQQLP